MARTLEVTFNASGAAEAGARGRVVCVVDVLDSSTSAEAALSAGAAAGLGAAPADADPPVTVRPDAVGMRAVALAGQHDASVLVVAEPRVGSQEERQQRAAAVLNGIQGAAIDWELVPNQGAELPALASCEGRIVVVVSTTGGTAFDAAIAAGAPAACFATTARVGGMPGRDVAEAGVSRAVALCEEHAAGLTIVAASANSLDDVLAAQELARRVIERGFLTFR
ncbi:MAG TPA: hypothetical protein VF058_03810 [Actinomycetota bacterium]